jgi:hypothetical protein
MASIGIMVFNQPGALLIELLHSFAQQTPAGNKQSGAWYSSIGGPGGRWLPEMRDGIGHLRRAWVHVVSRWSEKLSIYVQS